MTKIDARGIFAQRIAIIVGMRNWRKAERRKHTRMRLIDADALIEDMNRQINDCETFEFVIAGMGAVNTIKKQPTVEAITVVRCKECFMRADCKAAVFYGDDGYCSIGKKAGDAE